MTVSLRRRWTIAASVALACLALGACGDDSQPATDAGHDAGLPPPVDSGPAAPADGDMPPPDDGAMPPPTDAGGTDPLTDFCTRGAMIECSGNQHCCAMPYATVDACVAAQTASCHDGLTAAFASTPGLHIDPARTGAFYTFVQSAADLCVGSAPDFGLLPVAGTVPDGGDCTGTGAAGDLSLFKCAEGLACSIDSAGRRGRCAPRPGPGGACTSPYMCPPGQYCTANFDVMPFTPGTCAPLLADAMACTSAEQCLGGACNDMGLCAPLAQTFCFGGA